MPGFRLLVLACLFYASYAEAIVYFSTQVGCFSELNGWTLAGTDATYTPGTCGQQCHDAGTPLFALSGDECYCGSAVPPDSVSSDSNSCSVQCQYYAENTCGAHGVYVVYLLQGEVASTAASSLYAPQSTSTSTESSESSESTESSSSATSSSTAESSSATTTSSSQESSSLSSSTSDVVSSTTSAEPSSTHTLTQTNSSSTATSQPSSSSTVSSTEMPSSNSTTTSSPTSSSTDAESSSTSSPTTSSSSQTDATTTTSTESASASASGTGLAVNSKKKNSSGLSGGAIAGIVVGVVCGVGAVAAVLVGIILWRRKHNNDEVYSPEASPDKFKSDFGSFHDPYPAPPRPLLDPRLNPAMLGDPRISIASLADARDYSRQVLTVTNPDEKS